MHFQRKTIAVAITLIVAWTATYISVNWLGDYGWSIFILTPVFIGIAPVVLFGREVSVTSRVARSLSFLTLIFYAAGLVAFAWEGLICIIMSAPLGLGLTFIGSVIGIAILRRMPNRSVNPILVLAVMIPLTAFVSKEDDEMPQLIQVRTSILIKARPEVVWKNVIVFSPLQEPTELLFRAGIAYPMNAHIDGEGVGAIRYCNFSTGSFVEPITAWNEPTLLEFTVNDNPPPMKELSFYDEVKAPHLHDYFLSKRGQFKLTPLKDGQETLLEGTTWYYHKIKPAVYWKLWSDYIIHKIHMRVLNHIKEDAEAA